MWPWHKRFLQDFSQSTAAWLLVFTRTLLRLASCLRNILPSYVPLPSLTQVHPFLMLPDTGSAGLLVAVSPPHSEGPAPRERLIRSLPWPTAPPDVSTACQAWTHYFPSWRLILQGAVSPRSLTETVVYIFWEEIEDMTALICTPTFSILYPQ